MKNSQSKRPLWVKLTIIILSVLLGLSILLGGFIGYFKLSVKEYYDNSERAFEIPGLSTSFVPQGFCYDDKEEFFLIGGYMTDKSASTIYTIDKDSGKAINSVRLYKDEDTIYNGHCSGIAFFEKYFYLSDGSDKCIYVFDYTALKNCADGEKLVSIGTFSTGNVRPSCITVSGSGSSAKLIVAEFYNPGDYETEDSHKITTPAGDKNTALAVQFSLTKYSNKSTFCIDKEPTRVYSLPSQVQGLVLSGNNMFLSTSYGLAFSEILVYDVPKSSKGKIDILGYKDVDLYHLDSASLTTSIKAPPMSEEIVVLDNKLYINNESASNKYIFGKFTGGQFCYVTDLSKYGL